MDRDQRQSQGVQPAQQALQTGLVKGAGQDGDRRVSHLVLDANRYFPPPVCPALVEVTRHFDLVGHGSVQGKLLFILLHDLCLSHLSRNRIAYG
jgi:hypothetical protein